MHPFSMRSIALAGAALVSLAACSSQPPADSGSARFGPAGGKSVHIHTDDHHHGGGHGDGHSGDGHSDDGHSDGAHGGHVSPAQLSDMLLSETDVPERYVAGSGHEHGHSEEPLRLADACLPIAHLIGSDHAVRQTEHPEARTAFVKSHIGPLLTESVIDYGSRSAATEALAAVRTSSRDCTTYRQSMSAIGANTYQVRPVQPVATAGEETIAVRLDAQGRDFEDVAWHLVVVRKGQFLVTVGYRTTVGAAPTELVDVLPAAVAKVA